MAKSKSDLIAVARLCFDVEKSDGKGWEIEYTYKSSERTTLLTISAGQDRLHDNTLSHLLSFLERANKVQRLNYLTARRRQAGDDSLILGN